MIRILTNTRYRVNVKKRGKLMDNYYTVTEYANINGKDPGNVRKMLIQGKIEGKKLGKQWVIPKGTVWPEDRRVKSGEYKNWRNRWRIYHNEPRLMKSLSNMSKQIGELYGDKIDRIVLYGSYARGDHTWDSDVDIAVFLYDNTNEQLHDKMTDIIVDYELDLGVTLSVVCLEMDNYLEWKKTLPFYVNIDKEGIVLWKNRKI